MRLSAFLLPCLLFLTVSSHAKDIQTGGKVCPAPTNSCESAAYDFQSHELSFQLPAPLTWQSAHYSASFYAVILRSIKAVAMSDPQSDEECKGFVSENKRLEVQAQFPENKVFTSRNGCFPMVYYTNVDDKYNFIAVYAGNTAAEAETVLKRAKAAGYLDANIRKMQVVVDNGH